MTKEDLKIVFFGTPDFAAESLRTILENGFNVAAVVTATDKPAGRGHKTQSSAVKKLAEEYCLRILQPEKLKDEQFIETLREINADLFVVIAFRMLPEVVWSMPRFGTFNLHASLLPKYRGAAPINRAVMNGETKSGVTTFFIQHDIDTGDIIDREEVDILADDDAGSLHDKLMNVGARLTVKTINAIIDGSLKTFPQRDLIEEGAETCGAPKIFKETGKIDWAQPAQTVHNLIRGLSPYPGAWSELRSETTVPTEIKIFKSALTDQPSEGDPGKISVTGRKMYVDTATEKLELLEIQPAGKKRMGVDAFLLGARIVNPFFNQNQ